MDGLERLIVVGVGLDERIESSGGDGAARQTRSRIYRAMTRAHMLVLLVNEMLQGGWLEFLGCVDFDEGEKFDHASQSKMVTKEAAEVTLLRRELKELASKIGMLTEELPWVEVCDLIGKMMTKMKSAVDITDSQDAKMISQYLEKDATKALFRRALGQGRDVADQVVNEKDWIWEQEEGALKTFKGTLRCLSLAGAVSEHDT